jgi:hypothetical protein
MFLKYQIDMFKASIHAGLRDATFGHWVIFVADVDYYEMSRKISPEFCTNFSEFSPTASGITFKLLRELINKPWLKS